MPHDEGKICVYYDGACPQCLRDRQTYEKLAGKAGNKVCWVKAVDYKIYITHLKKGHIALFCNQDH